MGAGFVEQPAKMRVTANANANAARRMLSEIWSREVEHGLRRTSLVRAQRTAIH
jgi:hypothetical protein